MQKTDKKVTLAGFMIYLLAVSYYFYEFVIQVSPNVMTDSIMETFLVNATVIGMVSGVYYYTYTLMQLPSGLLLDRFGARWVLTSVVLVCALGALCFAYAPNIYWLGIGRLLAGAGSAFAFVSVLYLATRWFPAHYFALIAGITQMIGSMGAIGGETPLAYLNNVLGWRQSFLWFAIIGVLLAALIALFVRNQPKDYHKHTLTKNYYNTWQSLKVLCSNKQTWYVGLMSLTVWTPMTALAALWGVAFLKAGYLEPEYHLATAICFVWIGNAASSIFIGWWSDYIKRRCMPMSFFTACGLIASILLIYFKMPSFWMVYFLMFVVGAGTAGQALSFAVVKENNPKELTGTAMGFNNMAVVCSGAIFQPLVGKLLDMNWSGGMLHGVRVYDFHAYQIALSVVPLCFLISLIMSMFFVKETYAKSEHE